MTSARADQRFNAGDWRGDSVDEVLGTQAQGPESESQNPRGHAGINVTPGLGTWRRAAVTSQTSPFRQPQAPGRDPDSKKQGVGVDSHVGARL